MKIAYCFHGHMRSFKQAAPSFFEHIHSVYPGDIHIHTWDDITQPEETWWRGKYSPTKVSSEDIERIYRPKTLVIESQSAVINSNIDGVPISDATYKDTESTLKSFIQAKKHAHYDKFFMLRPDIAFKNKMTIEEITDMDHIYICRHDHFTIHGCVGAAIWFHADEEFTKYATNFHFYSQKYLLIPIVECNYSERCGEFFTDAYYRMRSDFISRIRLTTVKFCFIRGGLYHSKKRNVYVKNDVQEFTQDVTDLKYFERMKTLEKVVQFGASPGFGKRHLERLISEGVKVVGILDNFKTGTLCGMNIQNPSNFMMPLGAKIVIAVQIEEWRKAIEKQCNELWPETEVKHG